MRLFLLGVGSACCLIVSCFTAAESAERVPMVDRAEHHPDCLSTGDTIEAVSSRQVVAPARAIVAAKGAAPGAEILRASLCRDGEGLAYMVTALRKDGRVVRVTVEAASGKIKLVH